MLSKQDKSPIQIIHYALYNKNVAREHKNKRKGDSEMDMHLMTLISEAFDRYNATASKKNRLDWKKDIIERIRYMQTEEEVKMFIEEIKGGKVK